MLHSIDSLKLTLKSVIQSYKSIEFTGSSEQGHPTMIGTLNGRQGGISICVFSDVGSLDPNVYDLFTFSLKRDNIHKLVTQLQNGIAFEYKATTNHITSFEFINSELHIKYAYGHLPPDTAYMETSYSISLSNEILKVLTHNSGWNWNSKCPCGSQLPFNSCCHRYQSKSSISVQDQIRLVDSLINDDSNGHPDTADTPTELINLKHLIDSPNIGIRSRLLTAHADPDIMQLANFWGDLGHALGVNQYFDESITCFDKAIELDPDLNIAKLDKCVSLSQLGKHKQALKLIDAIPETTDRYELIKANILQDSGNRLEAIPLYEMAIARNPNFFLPYINIISILEDLSHPSLEFWIDNAVRLNREHPVIAHKFAKYMFESNRFEELVLCEWIDQVGPVDEESVINRPSYDFEAQACKAYKATAVALLNRDQDSFNNLANLLSTKFDYSFQLCGLGRTAISAATQYGFPHVVSTFHSLICENCKDTAEDQSAGSSSLEFMNHLAWFA